MRILYQQYCTCFEYTRLTALYIVLANGGFISNDRINGILAVGRGFGDNYLKKPQSKANLLSCAPDLVTYIPQKSDTFIVIASDGLWDVYTSEEVVEKIHAFLGESNIYTELSGTIRTIIYIM